MPLINLICFLLPSMLDTQLESDFQYEKDLLVCYGKMNPHVVKGYATVVLETEHYESFEIKIFKKNNGQVLGYLSLTEVTEQAYFYENIEPYTFSRNENWGSRYINIESTLARDILINAASKLMKKGLDGLFLDNLDNVSKWGPMPNQKNNLLRLIEEIKNRNENCYLMQNSGLFLRQELHDITHAILVESVYTLYNFKNKQYDLNNKINTKSKLKLLNQIKNKPIFILEYAEDEQLKIEIEKKLLKLRYNYFIANIDLMAVPEFKRNK